MTDSQSFLAEYVRTGSETAFRELVTRYVDLVYSTARRLVEGDTHRAQDVTQVVFVDLARAARTLSSEVMLGGWLHRHTCFVAARTMRGERRRQSRERQAVEMNALQDNSRTDFSLVAPILDEAINELGDADRTAVLLRFFEQHDFCAVGEALGSNEDAARMRVSRALDKLQGLLKRRGVTTSAATLSVVLSANAVQAAPVGLAVSVTVSTVAALAGTAVPTSTALAATKTIAMTALQKTLIVAGLAAAVGAGIYESRQASALKSEVRALRQQQAPLVAQIDQLTRDRDEAATRQATLQQENEGLRQAASEVPRLRGEVARLRAAEQLAQSKRAGADMSDPAIQGFLKLKGQAAEIARYLDQMPDKKIPELKLLLDEDWLAAVRTAKFDTDADIRRTLSQLRSLAKNRVPMGASLNAFIRANNEQLPTDLSQLKPYIKSALGDVALDDPTLDAIIERYALLRTGSVNELPPGTWIIAEKAPVDKEYDSRAKFGNGTSTIIGTGLRSAGDPDDKSY
jgi:RNA polymerase sigma factor (sigma-70 family)